ncbi:MAG TPA: hypothetical protein PLK48_06675 [Caldisericia bacterium]|nr:hypothetical protein [Caldisericia bacterium]
MADTEEVKFMIEGFEVIMRLGETTKNLKITKRRFKSGSTP